MRIERPFFRKLAASAMATILTSTDMVVHFITNRGREVQKEEKIGKEGFADEVGERVGKSGARACVSE